MRTKKSPNNAEVIGKAIGGVLNTNMSVINNFKLGNIDEATFNEKLISALEQATNIRLTTEEFDNAWSAMYPSYSQYSQQLNEVIYYNNQPDQKVYFISFTNPKDIRHLTEQLKSNGISHTCVNGKLIEIGGVGLFSTYSEKKSKSKLIQYIVERLTPKPFSQSPMAIRMSSLFKSDSDSSENQLPDIKYIRGVNNINDPILKIDLENTNKEVESQAAILSVETILWKKYEQQTFSSVLNDNDLASKNVPIVSL